MLTEQGHQVTVFISDKSVRSLVVEKSAEARLIRFNPDRTNTSLFLGTTTQLSYEFSAIVKATIEKEGKPDVIETQDYNGIGYYLLQFKACLADWCKDIPVVVTMHSPSFLYLEYNEVPLYKRPNYWIGEMERFCIQAADLLISPSQYLVDEIRKRFKISNSNLHVLVNPFKFTKSEKKAIAAIDTNNFAFYGKLSPQKGTFRILEEFQFLWDHGLKESFTMIGGQDIVFHPAGKTMGALVREKYSAYMKSGLLQLNKSISPADLEASLSKFAIFIVPSIVDNLPYVVLELMSLGKIVIVSNQGGQSEVVTDGVDGFIFDYNKKEDFGNTILKVLNLDAGKRLAIAEKAKMKIQDVFEYKNVYDQKIVLLERLKTKYAIPVHFPFIRDSFQPTEDDNIKNNKLLSVVIPYYNLGEYLAEAVDSVLSSTYKEIELIIINDGSTDVRSNQKLQEYKKNPSIRVIEKENTGLADTRNVGAEMAQGAFLAFLDADDVVDASYYEKAIRILKQYDNVHFVGAWTQYFGNSKAVWPTFNPEPPLLLTHNTINSSALIYKRNAFIHFGKNDVNFKKGLEDYESVIRMKSNRLNGVAIPEILFKYRVRKNSMIKGVDKKVRADYYEKIANKHKDFFSAFDKEILNILKDVSPLNFDNATLDDLPFQNIPFLNKLMAKLVLLLKSNPTLKRGALSIKRALKKQ